MRIPKIFRFNHILIYLENLGRHLKRTRESPFQQLTIYSGLKYQKDTPYCGFTINFLGNTMVKKTKFNKSGVEKIPSNKPVLYRIQTESGKDNYVGIAKRGRAPDRIGEHIGSIPGAKVVVEQFSSIGDARSKEKNVIKRNQPKYNDRGK